MSSYTINRAEKPHMEDVRRIYAHYVEHTTVCLDEYVPPLSHFEAKFDEVAFYGLPFLVAINDQGKVVGYAYAIQYRPRSAYRFAVEQSVYLDPDYVGQGIGKSLVEELLKQLDILGIRQVVAVITKTDHVASKRLHDRFGFEEVGCLSAIAFKQQQWIDAVILQKPLGDGSQSDPVDG